MSSISITAQLQIVKNDGLTVLLSISLSSQDVKLKLSEHLDRNFLRLSSSWVLQVTDIVTKGPRGHGVVGQRGCGVVGPLDKGPWGQGAVGPKAVGPKAVGPKATMDTSVRQQAYRGQEPLKQTNKPIYMFHMHSPPTGY